MAVWWITLFSTYILCLIARKAGKSVVVEGIKINHPNAFFATLACSILVGISGLRSSIGDTENYIQIFNSINTGPSFWSDVFDKDEWGFRIFQWFIKYKISDDVQIYIFITAMITITLVFVNLYKYCGILEIGVFTFITAGNYLVTMNGIRQYLVSAILFFAFPLIYKRKWYLYLPLVVLGATMHKSALIMIPLYFIVYLPAWGKTSKGILIGGISIFICYPIVGPLIVSLLEDSTYSHYGTELLSGEGGANIIRTCVYVVPVILAYIRRDKLSNKEKYFNIVLNMSLLNLVAMLLANKYWIFARFCMYFSLFTIILFCWCIKYCFKKREKSLVYCAYIVLFSMYYFYEIHISLGQAYISNYIK